MASEKQISLICYRVRSSLGYKLPEMKQDGVNRIYEHIKEQVKDFSNEQVNELLTAMDKAEDDAVYGLTYLEEKGIIPVTLCGMCKQPRFTQCCC